MTSQYTQDVVRVVSGVRPTGELHIGNYFGALVDLAKTSKDHTRRGFFFVADLHALTTVADRASIQAGTQAVVLAMLASGVDPATSYIYRQSAVPDIAVLDQLLRNFVSVHALTRMHHFKGKKKNLKQRGREANLGLLGYPVLMAADILAVRAQIVPVGDDQRQHVEFARQLARTANREIRNVFVVPDALPTKSLRIPSLTGSGKMSKSDPDGAIMLTDPNRVLARKISRTDKRGQRIGQDTAGNPLSWDQDPGDPRKCPVYDMLRLAGNGSDMRSVGRGCRQATMPCGQCKQLTTARMQHVVGEVRERMEELRALGADHVEDILRTAERAVREDVVPLLDEVRWALGLAGPKGYHHHGGV